MPLCVLYYKNNERAKQNPTKARSAGEHYKRRGRLFRYDAQPEPYEPNPYDGTYSEM